MEGTLVCMYLMFIEEINKEGKKGKDGRGRVGDFVAKGHKIWNEETVQVSGMSLPISRSSHIFEPITGSQLSSSSGTALG